MVEDAGKKYPGKAGATGGCWCIQGKGRAEAEALRPAGMKATFRGVTGSEGVGAMAVPNDAARLRRD